MTCTCKRKGFLHKLFHGSGNAVFALFVWELIEEALENAIAYFISWGLAIFAIKVVSTIGIIVATQGVKTGIKRFLFPFIKTLTYKEGNDKMSKLVAGLKNYWTLVWGNKITGTIPAIGFAVVSYIQTLFTFATGNIWIALLVFVIVYNIAIFGGGEYLHQILARIDEKTKNKELKKQLKKVQHAQAIVDQYEEAKKIVASAPKQN